MRAINTVLIVLGILILIPIVQAVYAPSGQADITANLGVWDFVLYLNDSNISTCGGVGGDAFHNMTWNIKYQISNGLEWPVSDANSSRNITIPQSHSCIWSNAFHAAVQSSATQVYYKCYTSAFSVVTLYVTNGTQSICEVGEVLWNTSAPYFTIKDEKTELDLTYQGTLQIFGSNYSVSYTIPTSGYFSLPADTYNIRLAIPSPLYNTRNWYFTYNASDPTANYSLYMLNYSYAQLTTFQVTDTASKPIPGAYVSAYRQMIKTNSYQMVEMALTDNNGNTIMSLEPYTVPYKIYVIKDNITLFETTLPQYITSATNYIKIDLTNDTTQDYFKAQNVAYGLYYNNASKRFVFTFNDTANSNVTAGKLDVILETSLTTTTLCSNTINASTGTIYCNISAYLNRTGTIYGYGYVKIDNEFYHLDTASKSITASIVRSLGLDGAVYAFILILVIVMIGLWNPIVAVVLAGAGLGLSVAMGLIPLEITWVVGIIALGIIGIKRLYA